MLREFIAFHSLTKGWGQVSLTEYTAKILNLHSSSKEMQLSIVCFFWDLVYTLPNLYHLEFEFQVE